MDFTSWPAAEKRGAIAAVVILVLGTSLAAVVIDLMKGDSATFIALLVIAVIVYGVVSGKIQEFFAPGGWSAKFQEMAKQKVGTTATACLPRHWPPETKRPRKRFRSRPPR